MLGCSSCHCMPSICSKHRGTTQGSQVPQKLEVVGIQKPPPTPKSFTFYVKPVVRWASMALAAFMLTWTILGHMAAQRAQHEQEASHQRCWPGHCGTHLLTCCLTD